MNEPTLRENHLIAFGAIIAAYAGAEQSIKLCLSAMINQDISTTMVLTEPYSALNLRNVVKSVAKIKLDDNHAEKLVGLIGAYQSHSRIRNQIAHNTWIIGERPGSIKPISMDIREGKASPKGFEKGEKDYTLQELEDMANELIDLRGKFLEFQTTSGLLDIIERKLAEDSASIEASDGIS